MPHETTLKRVRLGALLLMLGVAAELIRYSFRSFDRALTFSFQKQELWNNHRWVDPGTTIELGARVGYFAIWTIIIFLSILSFLSALHLLNHVRKGRVFDIRSAQAIRRLGLVLGTAMVADLIFHAFDPWLITRFNAEPLPIRWGYDPSDIKTLVMAMILFLFGWVMRESIDIELEHKGFV